LCQGCGHNSIASQIIAACYELSVRPEEIVKFSGIGCASKSPTYFLEHSFGFNGLHGRMPSLATGALFADHSLRGLAVSGDGDTASIGMGQFKHVIRRNVPMVYIVENNGVYGLTKGQFSATAEEGLALKSHGKNPYLPIDIAWEALVSHATFVARSFAGDPKQAKELIKAAISHNGIAVLDIISPCVTFNNQDTAMHSYAWGKNHEVALHDLAYVPPAEEIYVDYEEGEAREVILHDGSMMVLKKLERDYDPTNRANAMKVLEEANTKQWLLTGLIYIDPDEDSLLDLYNLVDEPLNRLTDDRLRPSPESLKRINEMLF
jgi:2-oxoglutarate ferredoxin oxidoreductase subunit beta